MPVATLRAARGSGNGMNDSRFSDGAGRKVWGLRSSSACVLLWLDRGRPLSAIETDETGRDEHDQDRWTIRAHRPRPGRADASKGGILLCLGGHYESMPTIRLRGRKHAIVETDILERADQMVDPRSFCRTVIFPSPSPSTFLLPPLLFTIFIPIGELPRLFVRDLRVPAHASVESLARIRSDSYFSASFHTTLGLRARCVLYMR